MATTPEEFFIMDLMEQPPASPPVFIDLPQKPNISNEVRHRVPNDDMMLPYISHMLMEDDIDDELNNHPALLQVQQPFAQILSSHSLGTNTNNSEGANEFLHEGNGDEGALNSPLSKGTCVLGAYLKGMEEANMLLHKDNDIRRDELVINQIRESNITDSWVRKRYNRDHLIEEEVRSANKAVTRSKGPEEKHSNEMLDEMMLHSYETCIKGMEHVTMDNSEVEKRNMKSGRIKVARVVDIRRLLISCAQALAADDDKTTRELLKQIQQHASATGDATQRLAHCFAMGLEARIVGSGSQLLQRLMLEYPSAIEFLKAYKLFSEVCCFINVTFIFSAMTIMQAMAGKSRLHIVDYGTRFGFQWAGLLRLLASKKGGLPEVKITAIARPKPMCHPGEQIEKIGCRLRKCAHELGLPSFKFHTIMKNWEDTFIIDMHTDSDEVLVVSDMFSFGILMEESLFFDDPSPRDTVLHNIKKMRPDVFIQNVINRSYGASFLSRFRDTVFYYMALFDMLDATIPRDSKSRLLLEKVLLGCHAFNSISCEGMDLVEIPEKYKQWQTRNQRAGLRQLPLKSSILNVVKDEVMKHYHKDFMISQDGQWLLQGWMGRVICAHTTWVANEDTSSE